MPVTLSPSSDFIDTLRFGSYLVAARLTLYYNVGQTGTYYVPVSAASITVDRNAAQRRQGSFTAELVPDPSNPAYALIPTGPSSKLTPFGNEVLLELGVAQSGGTVGEFVSLGLFTLTSVVVDDTSVDIVITCDIADRSFVISQRAFVKPYNFPATEYGYFSDEIHQLLQMVWGVNQRTGAPINNWTGLTFNITPTNAKVPTATYDQGSDPWQAALDMAAAVGYELYFGLNGEVMGHPIPDPSVTPPPGSPNWGSPIPVTWNFTDDTVAIQAAPSRPLFSSPFSTPIATQVTYTRSGIFNDIYITGTGMSNAPFSNTGNYEPVIAERFDNYPGSATNISTLGDLPEFVASNMVVSSDQANATAENDLVNSISSSWQCMITASPNPLFDVDDVVTITRPRVGLVNVRMVIDQIVHVISYNDSLQITGRIIEGADT